MAPSFFSHKTSVSSSSSSVSSKSPSSSLSQYPYGKAGEGLDFTPSYPYEALSSSEVPSSIRAVYSKDGRGHEQSFYSSSYPYAIHNNTSTEALNGRKVSMSQYPYFGQAGKGIDWSKNYAKRS